ncbi:MAG: type II secretion system F family protein [Candidatus Omnitrophica bacterium]|nr:type II secretion system F family protein [Candidatus Omnitrophota bacterium]
MKKFIYRAKEGPETLVEGKINASDKEDAVNLLSQRGLVATYIEEETSPKQATGRYRWNKLFGIRSKELTTYTRQLANLLKSGIPILRSLMILSQQANNDFFKDVLLEVADKVKQGKQLSEALQDYPQIFSRFYVAMVKTGEDSGAMHISLTRIVSYYKRQDEFVSKVKSALTYPALIIVVGFLTVLFIFTNVIPKIMPIFVDLGVSLPLPTKILLSISAFFKNKIYLTWFILILVIIILILKRSLKITVFRNSLSVLRLKLPVFGRFIFKSEFSRFARALETSLRCGIPVIKAIDLSLPVVKEPVISNHLASTVNDLQLGGSFGKSLNKEGNFDLFVVNMISIGEESGDLAGSLENIAESFEADCEESIKIFTTLLEPILVLIVGLTVAFIVSAVLLPIFELNFLNI